MDDNLSNKDSCACKVYETQGNRPGSTSDRKNWNLYAGNDNLQNGIIPHGSNETLYVAQWGTGDDPHTKGSGYFTDQQTVKPCIHDGKLNADELGNTLQTMPSDKHVEGGHLTVNKNSEGFRPSNVNAYNIDWDKLDSLKESPNDKDRDLYNRLTNPDGCSDGNNDIKCAFGTVKENPQFGGEKGGGGGNQYYIDKNTFNDAVQAGVFKYDRDKSYSISDNNLQRSAYSAEDMATMRDKAKDMPTSLKTPEEINSTVADSSRYGSYIAKPDPAYTQNHQQSAQNADVEKIHGHDAASDQYRRGPPDNVHSENSTASETHDSNTHSSDDIAKGNHHADADATEAKRDSASESKETSKDIASEPEGAGSKEQKADSQPDQGNNERASSEINANATDDSLSRTKTADASEKATESGSGSLEHETGKAQPASKTADNTPEESGQASVTQPDNNLAKDADNESPHGQSETNTQNNQSSHASTGHVKQSDESRTNDAGRNQTPEGEMSHDTVDKSACDDHETAQANHSVETSKNTGRNSIPENQATQEQRQAGISSDKAVATPETNTKDRAADQASAAESPKQDSSAIAHSAQSTAGDSYNREQPSSHTPQRDSTALAGADSQNGNEHPEQSSITGPNVNDHYTDKAYEAGNTHKEASASQSAYDGNKNGESSDVPDSYRHSDTRTGADESNESTGMQNRWDIQSQRSHSADAENNSDGMPSKGRDTHLSNDAAMPPNTYQHNSDQNETAEGMSGSENVAATSDKSDSKASTQNSEVSENSTPRNDDSAQIPNSVDGKDTNSGAEKASGNSLNSSGSTNEFKNNGYQQ